MTTPAPVATGSASPAVQPPASAGAPAAAVQSAAAGSSDSSAAAVAPSAPAAPQRETLLGEEAPAAAAPPEAPKTEAPAPIELKVPADLGVPADVVDAYKATAAELGLDSAKAQKVFDLYAKQQASAQAALEAEHAKWVAEVKADPELGGAKFDGTKKAYTKAVMKFGGQPLAALLRASGLEVHPAVVRAFTAVGRALESDSLAGGMGTAAASSSQPVDPFMSIYTSKME